MYTVSIAVHASAGVLGFALGLLLALRPDLAVHRAWTAGVYLGSMVVLVLGLASAVVAGWEAMEPVRRAVDIGLIALSAYTLFRAVQAVGTAARARGQWRAEFVDQIGFTLISLFDGFVIVAAIRAGAPTPLVLIIAVTGVGAGIAAVGRMRSVAARTPPG